MVGQAARAADMRAGNVAKPGMKAMNGGGGSVSVSTQKYKPPAEEKAKAKPKALTHGQMAMQWEQNGRDANGKLIKFGEKKQGWSKEDVNRARDRAAEERRRAEAPVTVTAAADAGEVEPLPEGEMAHVLARVRMAELAQGLQSLTVDAGSSSSEDSIEQLWAAAEARRAQLEEVQCLEAMFVDEFLLVSSPEAVAALRDKCDSLGDDPSCADASVLREVAAHPPLEFSLQLTSHGERPVSSEDTAAEEQQDESAAQQAQVALVASILLRVRFPLGYPKAPPVLTVEDAMVTTHDPLGRDKMLTSVAMLREDAMVAAMVERAAETLPDPCIFEAATWATEAAFEFVGPMWI